jgi:rod shape-determining protein MreD
MLDGLKAGALIFVAVMAQTGILSSASLFGGSVDLPLVTVLCLALLRGSIFGAVAGFWAGLLLDTATLGTLGFTSLLLTGAGFWIGRYGETTARDRAHAPFLSVGVVTVLYAIGSLALHFFLGEPAPARLALVDTLPAELALNLILTLPVYALCRRLFPPAEYSDRIHEVRLLG